MKSAAIAINEYLRHLLKLHMGLSTSVAVDALCDSERRYALHQASSPSATLITGLGTAMCPYS